MRMHAPEVCVCANTADDDPIAQAFVQRRTSLNEEQFKGFLSVNVRVH